MESLFKPSFPHFYRKRSGERDVSARATHLKAEIGNVSISTTERKQMSTKTTFKRIALVAVAALGLGVLSVAPSSAAINATDETLTLSAASASVAIGETASVTITSSFVGSLTAGTAGFADSRTILVTGTGAGGTPTLIASNSDSANVRIGAGQYFSAATTANQTAMAAALGDSYSATTAATFTKGVFTLDIVSVTTTGTFTYTVSSQDTAKSTLFKTATFTVTVTAGNTTPVVANSGSNISDRTSFVALQADSALVVASGAVGSSAAAAGYITWVQKNSDSLTTTTGGSGVGESVVVTITSGPGALACGSTAVVAGTTQVTCPAFTVGAGTLGYATVYNTPGLAGLSTITIRTSNMNPWATKTLNFYSGTVDSLVAVQATTITGNVALGAGTVAEPATVTGAVRVTAKDSGANVIQSGALIYLFSSDTYVVSNYGRCSSTSITAATSYYACNLTVRDSGTVTLTVGDSTTIAKSVKTTTLSITVTGSAYTGTAAFDKTSYNIGAPALLTLTVKDASGRIPANGVSAPWTSMSWKGAAPTFSTDSSANAAGGSFTALTDYLTSGTSYFNGTDTAMVFMPTTAGTYTLQGKIAGATALADILIFTVVDPAATAQAAATAAAKDASDAATDAALEATDAAYAATDAANIAAEAADAATAAAEAATEAANAAKESADAATAAVEELATSVAKLMAALQAQITTLAKVVAKIAVKVKA